MQQRQNPSRGVVEAVAEREGVHPTEVTPPLQTVVDPDCLDSLFTGGTGRVQFEYAGYEVRITSDDEVEVSPIEG